MVSTPSASSTARPRRLRGVAVSVLALLPMSACSASDDLSGAAAVDDAPSQLLAASALVRSGIIGDPLTEDLVVQVVDARRRGVHGVTVRYEVVSGGGSLSQAASVTDAEGMARSRWTLGPHVGVQTVRAAVPGVGETLFQAQADAGETIGLAGGNGQTGAAGTALPDRLKIRVVDGVGRPVVGKAVSWRSLAGGGNVQAISGTTGPEGFAEAIWTLGIPLGQNRAQAQAGFGTVDFHAVSVPGPTAIVGVTPSGASLTVGDTRTFDAAARDRFSHGIEGVAFAWSSSNTGVITVDRSGKATAVGAGTAQVRATAGGVTGAASVSVSRQTSGPVSDPSAITNASVASIGQTSVTLRWVEVNDGTGNGASYAIRYATPTLDWASASGSELVVSPVGIGNVRQFTVQGLAVGTGYQFQIEPFRGIRNAGDVAGPRSPVLSATTTTTAPPVSSLDVSPNPINFTALNQTRQITATPRDANGNAVAEGVSFQSLTPTVATVSPSGVVSARAVGSATIQATATCCGVSADVSVNVNQVAASISISPTTFQLLVGNAQSMSAVVRDGNNNPVPGASIVWSSSNDNVASVSGNGVVTARTVGSAQIRAAAGSFVATATVIVVEPSGPSQPGDLQDIVIRPFRSLATNANPSRGNGSFPTKSGGSEGWDDIERSFSNYSLVRDPSAPVSPDLVLRIRYPVGSPPNTGPGITQTQDFTGRAHGFLTLTELEVTAWVKLGDNYSVGNVGNKLYFFRTNRDRNRPEPLLRVENNGSGGFQLQVNFQGTGDASAGPTGAGEYDAYGIGTDLRRGRWYELKTYLRVNSALGVKDGIFRQWVDGQLVLERTDVEYRNDSAPLFWNTLHVSPTYGGSGAPNPAEFDWFIDHVIVRGR